MMKNPSLLILILLAISMNKSFAMDPIIGLQEEQQVIEKNLKRIRSIKKIMLLNKRYYDVRVRPINANGDCGYSALNIQRQDFIDKVLELYAFRNLEEIKNNRLIELMKDVFKNNPILNNDIVQWSFWYAKRCDNGHAASWSDDTHLKLVSLIYNIKIYLYFEDTDFPNMFVPLIGEPLIDELTNDQASVFHLAYVPLIPGLNPNHYETLIVGNQTNSIDNNDDAAAFVRSEFAKQITNRDLSFFNFLANKDWMSSHLKVLTINELPLILYVMKNLNNNPESYSFFQKLLENFHEAIIPDWKLFLENVKNNPLWMDILECHVLIDAKNTKDLLNILKNQKDINLQDANWNSFFLYLKELKQKHIESNNNNYARNEHNKRASNSNKELDTFMHSKAIKALPVAIQLMQQVILNKVYNLETKEKQTKFLDPKEIIFAQLESMQFENWGPQDLDKQFSIWILLTNNGLTDFSDPNQAYSFLTNVILNITNDTAKNYLLEKIIRHLNENKLPIMGLTNSDFNSKENLFAYFTKKNNISMLKELLINCIQIQKISTDILRKRSDIKYALESSVDFKHFSYFLLM